MISSRGFYGAERVAVELCKGLKLYHCEPVIGVLHNSHNPHVEVIEEAKNSEIDTVTFPCEARLDVRLIPRIRAFVKENEIDLIHCHGYKSNFYGLLAAGKSTPTVTTNHNWLTSHWRLRVYRRLDSLLIRCFDRIVAVSDDVKKEMLKYAVPEKKIRVIDNGIDMARFHNVPFPVAIREEFRLPQDGIIIGTIGNLGDEKGQTYLLQAAKGIIQQNPSVTFLFVGEGPLKTSLENEAKQLGIDNNVIFTGYRSDIPRLLSSMDIFVLPSLKEGLPMVLLEAMAAKKPAIATRVGAIPKVIDQETGILVEPKDVFGLQRAIEDLLSHADKRQQYAAAGYATVTKNFSSERMSLTYFNLYKEVVA